MSLIDFTQGKSANATSSGDYSSSYLPANAFDDNESNAWISTYAASSWIAIDIEEAAIVTQLRYRTFSYASECPKSYALYASNTGAFAGEETLLDSKSNLTLTTYTWYAWDFANSTPFRYYRLVLTLGGGAWWVDAAEIELNGEEAPPPVPDPPTNIQALAGDRQVTLSWDSSTGATSYNIYFSTSPGVTPETGTKIAGATSPHIHDSLPAGQPYFYIVTAQNDSGESAASTEVSATPHPPYPYFNIYWSLSPGVTKETGTRIMATSSPYIHSQLQNGQPYFYVLTTTTEIAESADSPEVSATPYAAEAYYEPLTPPGPEPFVMIPQALQTNFPLLSCLASGNFAKRWIFKVCRVRYGTAKQKRRLQQTIQAYYVPPYHRSPCDAYRRDSFALAVAAWQALTPEEKKPYRHFVSHYGIVMSGYNRFISKFMKARAKSPLNPCTNPPRPDTRHLRLSPGRW
jgi:hypothetical protein